MKLKNVLLTCVLITILVVTSVFTVFADGTAPETAEGTGEGGGLLDILFGDGGLIEEVLPEGTDLDTIVGTITEELNLNGSEEDGETADEEDGEEGGILSGLIDTIKHGAEGFSLDSLGDLLGQLMGDEDGGFGSFDEHFEATSKVDKAEKEFVLNTYDGLMDFGDVQIVTVSAIWQSDDFTGSEEEFQELDKLSQRNYTMDDENQLWLISGADAIALLTLQKNEEGDYTVKEAEFAEDGDDFLSSLEALCEKVGEPMDDCMDTLEFSEWLVLFDMINYLNENPDVKGIEYDGEIRTSEELSEIQSAFLSELSAAMEDEDITEDEEVTAD